MLLVSKIKTLSIELQSRKSRAEKRKTKVDEGYSASIEKNLNPVNDYEMRSKPPDKVIKPSIKDGEGLEKKLQRRSWKKQRTKHLKRK